jgi:hypothetical protein
MLWVLPVEALQTMSRNMLYLTSLHGLYDLNTSLPPYGTIALFSGEF